MKRNPLNVIGVCVAAVSAAFASAAYAQSTQSTQSIDSLLMRNARQQAQIQDALANSRMDPIRAAQVQERAAEAYRDQAQMLASATDEQKEQMRQAQRDIAGAIAWAEKNPSRARATPLDRTRLQVASMRTAEQQRLIARGLADGRLSAEQVASLQTVQAQIVTDQADKASGGELSLDEARDIQGAQDVQDYSIKKDPDIARLVALKEGETLPAQGN